MHTQVLWGFEHPQQKRINGTQLKLKHIICGMPPLTTLLLRRGLEIPAIQVHLSEE